ncbi:MAG TPA: hypothetical protein VHR42_10570 [Clostridia bacterium]|nr:hypothetical protein [Clostridia bacterium]
MANNVLYANTKQLDKVADLLKNYPEEATKIMNRVLVRSESAVKSAVKKEIPKVYAITSPKINDALNGKKRKIKTIMGAAGEGSISIEVLGRPLTLSQFRATPKSPPEKTKSGKRRKFHVRAMFLKEKGMLPVGPVHGKDGKLKSVFLMPTTSGSEQYLFAYRTGIKNGQKEKLKVVRSVSVPQMVMNEKVGPAIIDKVNQTVFDRLTHELDWSFGNLGTNLAGGK